MSVSSYFLSYLHAAVVSASGVVDQYGLAIVVAGLFLESAGVIFYLGRPC